MKWQLPFSLRPRMSGTPKSEHCTPIDPVGSLSQLLGATPGQILKVPFAGNKLKLFVRLPWITGVIDVQGKHK